MTKQIQGQISFNFGQPIEQKEISMKKYINTPETVDIPKQKKTPVKKRKNSEQMATLKHQAPITEPLPSTKEKTPQEITKSHKTKDYTKNLSSKLDNCTIQKYYHQAADYVKDHQKITIGTIMRVCQISATDASHIFQKLVKNRIIENSGHIFREKKEL